MGTYKEWHRRDAVIHLRYVPVGPNDIAKECTVSGIGINIQILDPLISAYHYLELFQLFRDYDIDTVTLSAIWSGMTQRKLKKLDGLYRGIGKLCLFDRI